MDDTFASVMGNSSHLIPKAEWQIKTHFKQQHHETRRGQEAQGIPHILQTEGHFQAGQGEAAMQEDIQPIEQAIELPMEEPELPPHPHHRNIMWKTFKTFAGLEGNAKLLHVFWITSHLIKLLCPLFLSQASMILHTLIHPQILFWPTKLFVNLT
jgi:hypothetical protein